MSTFVKREAFRDCGEPSVFDKDAVPSGSNESCFDGRTVEDACIAITFDCDTCAHSASCDDPHADVFDAFAQRFDLFLNAFAPVGFATEVFIDVALQQKDGLFESIGLCRAVVCPLCGLLVGPGTISQVTTFSDLFELAECLASLHLLGECAETFGRAQVLFLVGERCTRCCARLTL